MDIDLNCIMFNPHFILEQQLKSEKEPYSQLMYAYVYLTSKSKFFNFNIVKAVASMQPA